MAYLVYNYGQGAPNVLDQVTVYMLKLINDQTLNGIATGFLTAKSGNNHDIYDNAAKILGDEVFLSSRVVNIKRSKAGVLVRVKSDKGYTLIKAKKLLIAIQPKTESLSFLDLTKEERSLFSQFNNSFYYNSVIRNSGIPDNLSLSNLDPEAPFDVPTLPSLYGVQAVGIPGLHSAYYGSAYEIPEEQVKENILNEIAKLSAGFPSQGTPEFVAFGNHAPFQLEVSADAIRNGFYRKMNGLQGKHSTWWTGATWQAHDSSLLWNFTETHIIPALSK